MLKTIIAIITLSTVLLAANAQAQIPIPNIEIKTVEGKYVNEELGIEITLPEGWSGMEFPSMVLPSSPLIAGFGAAPGGIDMTGMSVGSPMMMLVVMDAEKAKEIKAEPPSTEEFTEPTEPETVESKVECRVLSFNLVDVDGAKGMEGVVECDTEDENGNPITIRAKGLWVSQEFDNTIRTIQVMFSSKVEDYDKYINDFDNSLQTLRISNAKPLSMNLEKEVVEKVIIDDTEVDIKISSNSDISNVQFNEEDKSISFKVEGSDGSLGMAEIYLSNVLKGPYTVTIDGEPIDAIPIVNPETNEEGIKIVYMHSIHEVKIVGTEVVPEFPLAVLPILAIITGTIILLTRKSSLNI
ncbi:MAG: hypothetical protein KatS3mg003_1603 [Candidatus Nitrosocaldaceae archaeon]|nr:MAG: hypothetical protein KatS3mg003_1603 [Candidatus Nitrosocaldaceae archaeon]